MKTETDRRPTTSPVVKEMAMKLSRVSLGCSFSSAVSEKPILAYELTYSRTKTTERHVCSAQRQSIRLI